MKKNLSIAVKIILTSLASLLLAPTLDAFAATATLSTVSASANSNALVDTMCSALKLVTGGAGKAFAAFAIISVGIGFFTGKVSWGLMIGVAMGIAAMFGAPTIVAALSGSGTSLSCQ